MKFPFTVEMRDHECPWKTVCCDEIEFHLSVWVCECERLSGQCWILKSLCDLPCVILCVVGVGLVWSYLGTLLRRRGQRRLLVLEGQGTGWWIAGCFPLSTCPLTTPMAIPLCTGCLRVQDGVYHKCVCFYIIGTQIFPYVYLVVCVYVSSLFWVKICQHSSLRLCQSADYISGAW